MSTESLESIKASFTEGISILEETPAAQLPTAWETLGGQIAAMRVAAHEIATQTGNAKDHLDDEIIEPLIAVSDKADEALDCFECAEGSSNQNADYALGTTQNMGNNADSQLERASAFNDGLDKIRALATQLGEACLELEGLQPREHDAATTIEASRISAIHTATDFRDQL